MSVVTLARCAALLAAGLFLGAASPQRYTPLAMAEPLPPQLSKAPAATAESAFTPAPVPDLDLDGGFQRRGPARIEVTPSLFHQRQGYLGDGYTPNSTIQGEQTKKLHPAPGLNLSVPLP